MWQEVKEHISKAILNYKKTDTFLFIPVSMLRFNRELSINHFGIYIRHIPKTERSL